MFLWCRQSVSSLYALVLCRTSVSVAWWNAAGGWASNDLLPRGTSGRPGEASRDADTDDWVLHQPWRFPRLSNGRVHWQTEEVRTVRKHQRTSNTGYTRVTAWGKNPLDTLSLRSMSRRRSRLHECTPCRSIPSASPCRRQAKIERAQIVLDRSQPGLTP